MVRQVVQHDEKEDSTPSPSRGGPEVAGDLENGSVPTAADANSAIRPAEKKEDTPMVTIADAEERSEIKTG